MSNSTRFSVLSIHRVYCSEYKAMISTLSVDLGAFESELLQNCSDSVFLQLRPPETLFSRFDWQHRWNFSLVHWAIPPTSCVTWPFYSSNRLSFEASGAVTISVCFVRFNWSISVIIFLAAIISSPAAASFFFLWFAYSLTKQSCLITFFLGKASCLSLFQSCLSKTADKR